MTEKAATLSDFVDASAGEHRPECPILACLAMEQKAAGNIGKASR